MGLFVSSSFLSFCSAAKYSPYILFKDNNVDHLLAIMISLFSLIYGESQLEFNFKIDETI